MPMDGEIVSRVERRRKWSAEEKAALLAEVEAEGGRVAVVARRHQISDSLLYNWRSAWRAAAAAARAPAAMEFVPLGVIGPVEDGVPTRATIPEPPVLPAPRGDDRVGLIEIDLPTGTRLRVDAFVNEKALSRVFRAMKGSL
jgi:transposase